MAVGEIFLVAFITVLFEKLASTDLIRLARSEGIHVQLKKWEATLNQIQAVLADAGEKHLKERGVQLWLNKLQHLAYDIDDLLDDLATEAMRRQMKQESVANTSTSKVFKIIPKFSNFTPRTIMYGRKMSSKLDEITTKLRDLVDEKNSLGLNINVERSDRASRPLVDTSLVDVSKIVGREEYKEALLGKLLENESCSENVSLVSIVGLGGIGKTTLARVLYNEKEVKDHFELKAWVSVSDDFDVLNITNIILQAVDGEAKKFEDLNQLQESLSEKLTKRRFLFVLDDVWNEDCMKWELLQRPFVVGAPGSKIIVTTRKTNVASVMQSVQTYHMNILSKEEALSLLAQHALNKPNFDLHPTLRFHGEGIVKKCGELPLALIIVGRMLRGKENKEWEELLNSELWDLQYKDEILPALKLSYYDLRPYLKQMFAYCSLFPKGYMFFKDRLVLLWMAEGFLHESNGSKSMENLGHECFEKLLSRSFFQHLNTNDGIRFIMHDLIHDLATSVAGEFFFAFDHKMNVYDKNEALENFHHLSFVRQRYGVYKKFKALQGARRLRTFLALPVPGIDEGSHLSNNVLFELVPQLQFLRVLSLDSYSITEVPQSIGSLKHMRYLDFSRTLITCLPQQVGDLHNLQSLIVIGCGRLSSLPDSMVKLKNLRHLLTINTPKLNKMPLGIGGLTGLQTLSKVIVEEANGFKISDLKGLLHLQGTLLIQGLHTVINATHAKDADLLQKKDLDELDMEWSDVFDDSRNGRIEYEVLEGLRPYEKLSSLKILNYMGMKFPSWVGDPSFVYLTQLTLRGCRSCTCLPTLGHLRSLKWLFVVSMSGLKRVGSEFLGTSNSPHGIAFPSLECLHFEDMQDWEVWSSNGGDKDGTVGSYPCLRKIVMIDCPKLKAVEIGIIPSLEDLWVQGCSVAVLRRMVVVSPSTQKMEMTNIKGLSHLHGDVLEHFGEVKSLHISGCDELKYLWESKSEASEILNLKSLRDMTVKSCKNLLSLVNKEANLGISSKIVGHVSILDCPKLMSYNCPNSMERLVISNCDSITSLTFPTRHGHELPSTLKHLDIRSSSHTLEVSWLLNDYLSSLGYLWISGLPNVRSLPEGCLPHLTVLHIEGCENIKSIPERGFGFLPLLCLRRLDIKKCKNLKSFPHKYLQSLTSLKWLMVRNCPRMDYSFPCGLWPPNLISLSIGNLKKPISEWGLQQNFPASLLHLSVNGQNSGVVSSSLLVPPSLVYLGVHDFMELESLSKWLQHLTCLEELLISSCPKLRDLPETLLPSLSLLSVASCPKLEKRCRSKKGDYWPIISQIPCLLLHPSEG